MARTDDDRRDPDTRRRPAERPVRTAARAKAEMRSGRFITTAIAIIGETGRTDFTVQELIERSRSSLRSFYQHFGSKDELMLALFEEVMAYSTRAWQEEMAALDSTASLRLLVTRVSGPADTSTQQSINKALSSYHLKLTEGESNQYSRVLGPLHELVTSLVRRGAAERTIRTDVDPDILASLLLQTLLGAARLNTLGAEPDHPVLTDDLLWDFCMSGLTG